MKDKYWKAGKLEAYYSCYKLQTTELGIVWVYCYRSAKGVGYILPNRKTNYCKNFTYVLFEKGDFNLDRYK